MWGVNSHCPAWAGIGTAALLAVFNSQVCKLTLSGTFLWRQFSTCLVSFQTYSRCVNRVYVALWRATQRPFQSKGALFWHIVNDWTHPHACSFSHVQSFVHLCVSLMSHPTQERRADTSVLHMHDWKLSNVQAKSCSLDTKTEWKEWTTQWTWRGGWRHYLSFFPWGSQVGGVNCWFWPLLSC